MIKLTTIIIIVVAWFATFILIRLAVSLARHKNKDPYYSDYYGR